jgi:hypothetical protein
VDLRVDSDHHDDHNDDNDNNGSAPDDHHDRRVTRLSGCFVGRWERSVPMAGAGRLPRGSGNGLL